MFMEKENKASFNLLFNELTVDREKNEKSVCLIIYDFKINLISPGVSKNVSNV